MPLKKKVTKSIRFRRVSFKLSERQKELVERCARYERTTPNKFIKSAITHKLERYSARIEEEDRNRVSANQLSLFSFRNEGVQTKIADW
jgi:uncharacterized protein (DUF1778 family)